MDGEQPAGVCGVGFEFGAERGDVGVDGSGGGEGGVAPDGVEEAFAADDLAWVGDEES